MENSSPSRGFICLLLLVSGAAAAYWYPEYRPRPAAPVTPSSSSPGVHRYAQGGTFFMTRYAATRTPRGVYGFEPGCEVQCVRQAGQGRTMLVSDGRATLEVSPALLTRDIDVADAVRRADRAEQAAIATEMQRRQEAYEAAHRPIYIAHAQDVEAAELARARGSVIGGAYSSPLDEPPQPVGGYDNGYGLPASSLLSTNGNLQGLDAEALHSFLDQSPFRRLPSAAGN